MHLSLPLRSFILLPYFVLIIAGLLVPSDGGHGLLSIKSLAFIATTFTIFLYLCSCRKFTPAQVKMFFFLLASLAFFLAWMLISLIYENTPFTSAWDQFKICWLTISVIVISVYLVSEDLISFSTFLKTVIYTNCLYSTLKVTLVLLHIVGVISIWSIVETLGIRFMSMGILGALPRMQTSIDIATPFILFFFLQRKQFGISMNKGFCFYYVLISFAALFLSFSRFLIFVGVLSFLLHAMTLGLSRLMRWVLYFVASCVILVAIIGSDNAYTIIEKRLFSKENRASDKDRVHQIEDLWGEHQEFPLLGKGLGSYVPNNIRDKDILHSYEVQWMAFLMQFGIVGIFFILIGIGVISLKILSRPWTRSKIALFILFLAWLFSGFTNPFLVSLTSGILYTLFLLMGNMMSEQPYMVDNEKRSDLC